MSLLFPLPSKVTARKASAVGYLGSCFFSSHPPCRIHPARPKCSSFRDHAIGARRRDQSLDVEFVGVPKKPDHRLHVVRITVGHRKRRKSEAIITRSRLVFLLELAAGLALASAAYEANAAKSEHQAGSCGDSECFIPHIHGSVIICLPTQRASS